MQHAVPETARVRILDDLVVNQIAAGEVVERPASVVKELVENSLDAGATEITVTISNGGKSGIEVIDNGSGLSREDALVAVKRFGTSKIRSVEDLRKIGSLGFRGEALPSIASVSHFVLSSRAVEESDDTGVSLTLRGEVEPEVEARAMPPGTRVSVSQLFFNVPARRKFLRSERTEASLIKTVIQDFSVGYPSVRFRLVSDGVEVLNIAGASDFFARSSQLKLAGKDPICVDRAVETAMGVIHIRATLSRPLEAVQGSAKLRVIINGRVVRDRVLLRAIVEGYGTMLKPGRYPGGVVSLALPPEEVDVNVHPQKAEVRFVNSQAVFAAVAHTIRRALGDAAVIDPGSSFADAPLPSVSFGAYGSSGFGEGPAGGASDQLSFFGSRSPDEVTHLVQSNRRLSALRYVGQVFSCYLILEGAEELLIVDMHAAHERIRYNQIKELLLAGAVPAQALLIPQVVELPADLAGRFLQLQPTLQRFGFECDEFGEGSVVVRSVPILLSQSDPGAIFADLLALPDFADCVGAVTDSWDQVIARLACHSSIRSGRELERSEVYGLLEVLDNTENRAFCPHGRPIVRRLELSELENFFGRS